jgi:hypothetical protein
MAGNKTSNEGEIGQETERCAELPSASAQHQTPNTKHQTPNTKHQTPNTSTVEIITPSSSDTHDLT